MAAGVWAKPFKHGLGISGVYTTHASFFQKGKSGMDGYQIDLVLDRNDQVINLCEIKFYNDKIVVTKEMADSLRKKSTLFKHDTQTPKQVFTMLISTFGILPNSHSLDVVDSELSLSILFS